MGLEEACPAHSSPDPSGGRVIDVVVRDHTLGVILCELSIRVGARAVSDPMTLASGSRSAGTDALAGTINAVAGRIDAPPSDLQHAVGGWLARFAARRAKPRTIAVYRQTIEAAMRECGWTRVGDLTWDAITAYLSSHVESGLWKRSTYNRNLVVFRSLTRHLAKAGSIDRDPIADEPNAQDDSGEGARAATTEEARRQIAVAHAACLRDRRAKAPRDLVWLMLYHLAMRANEPSLLVWHRHVFVDEATPHVLFTPDINKSGRREEVPLTPELASLLRVHRETMRQLATVKPVNRVVRRRSGKVELRVVSPDDPRGVVFPWVPSRVEFRADRDLAGIVAKDRRGRGFSPHSARKWYETTLVEAGVHQGVIDRLMRHKGGIEARYRDVTLEKLCESVKSLPSLWPVAVCDVDNAVDHSCITMDPVKSPLTRADEPGNIMHANPDPSTSRRSIPLTPAPRLPDSRLESGAVVMGIDRRSGQPAASSTDVRPVQSTIIHPTMPIVGSITVDRTWLADQLELTARLLREGVADAHTRRASETGG